VYGRDGIGDRITEVRVDDAIRKLAGLSPLRQDDHHGAQSGSAGVRAVEGHGVHHLPGKRSPGLGIEGQQLVPIDSLRS